MAWERNARRTETLPIGKSNVLALRYNNPNSKLEKEVRGLAPQKSCPQTLYGAELAIHSLGSPRFRQPHQHS